MTLFVCVVLSIFTLAHTAMGAVITTTRYNGGDGTNVCHQVGQAQTCDFSGWWSFGSTVVEEDVNTGFYENTNQFVQWLAVGRTRTDTDASGFYNGVNVSGMNWGWGWTASDWSTVTVQVGTNNYSDSLGQTTISGSNSLIRTVTTALSSYYFVCDQNGLCTQNNWYISLADRDIQSTGWWNTFDFGRYTDGGGWVHSFQQQFPDSQFSTNQFWLDGSSSVATPEPSTLVLIGGGLVCIALRRRYKCRS